MLNARRETAAPESAAVLSLPAVVSRGHTRGDAAQSSLVAVNDDSLPTLVGSLARSGGGGGSGMEKQRLAVEPSTVLGEPVSDKTAFADIVSGAHNGCTTTTVPMSAAAEDEVPEHERCPRTPSLHTRSQRQPRAYRRHDTATMHAVKPFRLHYSFFAWLRSFSVRMAVLLALLLIVVTGIVATSTVKMGQSAVIHLWANTHLMKTMLLESLVTMQTNHLFQVLFAMAVRLTNEEVDIEGGVMQLLCTTLERSDTEFAFYSIELGSVDKGAVAFCGRYLDLVSGNVTYIGAHSVGGVLDAGYVLQGVNYALPHDRDSPASRWFDVPAQWRNVSARLHELYDEDSVMRNFAQRIDSGLETAIPHWVWRTNTRRERSLSLFFPLNGSTRLRGTTNFTADHTMYLKGRGNPATLFNVSRRIDTRFMLLASGTLTDADPVVFAANWVQPTELSGGVLSDFDPAPGDYITVSGVADPLMESGLDHLSLQNIAAPHFRRTAQFGYHGVPSYITAWHVLTPSLLPAVLVLVSTISLSSKYVPGLRLPFMALVMIVGLFFIFVFWALAEVLVSRPLRRMTVALRRNTEQSYEVPMRVAYTYRVLRIGEVEQVVVAFNAAMKQLKTTASFLPPSALLQLQMQNRRRRAYAERLRRSALGKRAAGDSAPGGGTATASGTGPASGGSVVGAATVAAAAAAVVDMGANGGNRVPHGEGVNNDSSGNDDGDDTCGCACAAAMDGVAMSMPEEETLPCVMTAVYIRFSPHSANSLLLDESTAVNVGSVTVNSSRPVSAVPPLAANRPAPSTAMVVSNVNDMFELVIELVVTLSERFGGLVHTLNPTGCVVHFRRNMQQILLQCGSSLTSRPSASSTSRRDDESDEEDASHGGVEWRRQCAITQDAEAAMRFVLEMYRQLQTRASTFAESVYLLADTTEFCCGQYYCAAVDQNVFLITGRNVLWEFETVLPILAAHTVMTEETAIRVRHCVRQLPLEAFCISRAGGEVRPYLVVLYEALPGSTEELPWVYFANGYMDAFLSMLKAHYNDALNLLYEIAPAMLEERAAAGDLATPPAAREEVEATRATRGRPTGADERGDRASGTVVAVGGGESPARLCAHELDRLIRECSRRVLMHDSSPYVRRPLTVDFLSLLNGPAVSVGAVSRTVAGAHAASRDVDDGRRKADKPDDGCGDDWRGGQLGRGEDGDNECRQAHHHFHLSPSAGEVPTGTGRCYRDMLRDTWSLSSGDDEAAVRRAIAGEEERRGVPHARGAANEPSRHKPTSASTSGAANASPWTPCLPTPATMIDNHGTQWALAKPTTKTYARGLHLCLGPAGTLAVTRIWPFRYHVCHDVSPAAESDDVSSSAPSLSLSRSLSRMDQHTRCATVAALLPFHLTSPYMVNAIGYSDTCDNAIAVINEYCPGGNLREVMSRFGRVLPVPAVVRYLTSILLCLQYLHGMHIVHGRLCPKNVMVGVGNFCKLRGFFTNYALAYQVFELKRFPYVSPEVAAGADPTAASDVFVVGLLLLELLTGHPPWRWSARVRHERGEAQLRELMRDRSGRFAVQLSAGNVELDLNGLPAGQPLLCNILLCCVRGDPAARITVQEALQMLASHAVPS